MTIMNASEIDYARTVSVSRPGGSFGEAGDYDNSPVIIIPSMSADIQQSLAIRNHMSEDESGSSDNNVWFMFCTPQIPLQEGDLVSEGDRTFIIDAVGDWGSHVECIMRIT